MPKKNHPRWHEDIPAYGIPISLTGRSCQTFKKSSCFMYRKSSRWCDDKCTCIGVWIATLALHISTGLLCLFGGTIRLSWLFAHLHNGYVLQHIFALGCCAALRWLSHLHLAVSPLSQFSCEVVICPSLDSYVEASAHLIIDRSSFIFSIALHQENTTLMNVRETSSSLIPLEM